MQPYVILFRVHLQNFYRLKYLRHILTSRVYIFEI